MLFDEGGADADFRRPGAQRILGGLVFAGRLLFPDSDLGVALLLSEAVAGRVIRVVTMLFVIV